jgi:hypothetical protein
MIEGSGSFFDHRCKILDFHRFFSGGDRSHRSGAQVECGGGKHLPLKKSQKIKV